MEPRKSNTVSTDAPQAMSPGRALVLSVLLPCMLYGAVVTIAGDRIFPFFKIPPGRNIAPRWPFGTT